MLRTNYTISDATLIDQLVQLVLHWRCGPDRFITENRSWIPKWRFNPLERLEDAFMLLDYSRSTRYAIVKSKGTFKVEVECNGKIGRAAGHPKARTITTALTRSLGIKVQSDAHNKQYCAGMK